MKKLFLALAFLFCACPAFADSLVVTTCGTLPKAYLAGATRTDTVDVNGNKCISGSSGVSAVNLTQILGAAPSLTNPLWVYPATGATFPVSGTVTVIDPVLTTTSSAALAANQIVVASAGALYSFNVAADATLSAAAWWIMAYNATSAPVDGAVTPFKCYAMPSGTTSYSAAFPNPVPFSTGIVLGVSTTGCFTKTASTHAFISGDYK